MLHTLLVEGMKQYMSGNIRGETGPWRTVSSKGSLIDFAVFGTGEWNAHMLKLVNGFNGLPNKPFNYILISQSLQPLFRGGGVFRKGLWGTRVTRPTAWSTYPEMEDGSQQASDHAAVFVDLDL